MKINVKTLSILILFYSEVICHEILLDDNKIELKSAEHDLLECEKDIHEIFEIRELEKNRGWWPKFKSKIGLKNVVGDSEKVAKYDIEGMSGSIPYKFCKYIDLINKAKKTDRKIKIPKVVLLHGPPGNGKTTLAKKFAELTSSDFIGQTAARILDKYFAKSAENMEMIFNKAIEHSKKTGKWVVVFIDEIDAIVNKNNSKIEYHRTHEEACQTLWTELDKIEDNDEKVIVIFATNKYKDLHGTVLSRIDPGCVIEVQNPDKKIREELIRDFLAFNDIEITENLPKSDRDDKNILKIDNATIDIIVRETENLGNRDILRIMRSANTDAFVKNVDKLDYSFFKENIMRCKNQTEFSNVEKEREAEVAFQKYRNWDTFLSIPYKILAITKDVAYGITLATVVAVTIYKSYKKGGKKASAAFLAGLVVFKDKILNIVKNVKNISPKNALKEIVQKRATDSTTVLPGAG